MRARRRPQAALVASLALALPGLPHGWPKTLQIGLGEEPGKHAPVQLGFRYQYLAGGVNTGSGWSTWNPNGTFASLYVRDSWAHHEIPVLTYYMLLQSTPSLGDEAATDLAHLRDARLMARYWADVRLLLQRVHGTKTVVVHVEPDLWGYVEQADATALGAAFAQQWVALRNRLAPNVLLAYHLSGWGTKHDIVYEDPPDATVRAYATKSAMFYRSPVARRPSTGASGRGSTSRSRTSRTATPASTSTGRAIRGRGSRRRTSTGTCSTARPSSARRGCGWSRGRSRSGTRS